MAWRADSLRGRQRGRADAAPVTPAPG
jgi:hypothetical protein